MHEYSILQSLLATVEEAVEQQAKRHSRSGNGEGQTEAVVQVRTIELRIGELSGVEVELLERAWTLFEDDERWGNAELRIETVPSRFQCPGCERGFERGQILRCPDCELPARMICGDEIVLQRLEMEVTEPSSSIPQGKKRASVRETSDV